MTCCVGVNIFLAQVKHGREDPAAFVSWTDLLMGSKLLFLRHLYCMIKAVWYERPFVVKNLQFHSNICRGGQIYCWTFAVCTNEIYNSTCWWTEQKKKEREREIQRLSEDSMWVTGWDCRFWLYLEEPVQVVLSVVLPYAPSPSSKARDYFHKCTFQKGQKQPRSHLTPSGTPCCLAVPNRDLKHLSLMGRRVVKRGKIMVRMFLLTL